MIINFLGDSITEAVPFKEEDKYVNLVAKALKCTVRSYGLSGTRIAKIHIPDYFPDDFQLRAVPMDNDADYVFVFGGTNDFGHGDAPMGDITSEDPYTFYGGLKTLISILESKYGREKLAFILPLQRHNQDSVRGENKTEDVGTLSDYVNVMKEVLDGYGIPYIDLYNHCVLDTPPKGASEFFLDGLHPNRIGHRIIAQAIVAFVEYMEFAKKQKDKK